MKNKIKYLLIASVLTCSAQIAVAEEKVVHVLNWSDYIDEEVLTNFTDATGIKVVYDVFDSNE
ncbi:MAG: spermidine/putrescine ABC transporter substrate-binding protein PotF, partial [Candidatus Marinimicrobia bacterium]|nr:spermidine/putrescine ABC transporter substrate-binding protein PotF [Candidatus Neomarinimicrobiota bacterium]